MSFLDRIQATPEKPKDSGEELGTREIKITGKPIPEGKWQFDHNLK